MAGIDAPLERRDGTNHKLAELNILKARAELDTADQPLSKQDGDSHVVAHAADHLHPRVTISVGSLPWLQPVTGPRASGRLSPERTP